MTTFARSAPVKPGVRRASTSTSISFDERLAARVHLEDAGTAVEVGTVDDDLTVETTRTKQCRVEDVGTVRRGDQDHATLDIETIHLDEQLVEGLLALVVSAAEPGAPVTTDGIDLVHEDDRRSVRLRLLEEVADAAGADADEHLDEVGTRDGEERNAGLAGHGAGEERLTGSRRAEEQHALGDLGPHRLELLRGLEVLLDLLELLDGLVESGDVGERDLRLVLRDEAGLRLTEGHHPVAAALHLLHEEEEEPDDDEDREELEQDREPHRALLRVGA